MLPSDVIGCDLAEALRLHALLLGWLEKKADFVSWSNHNNRVWDAIQRPLTPAEIEEATAKRLWDSLARRPS